MVKDEKQSPGHPAAIEPYRNGCCAPDAYAAMAPFGVTPASSAAAIHRAGLRAQKDTGRSGDFAEAWRELRNLEKRLALDLLYQQPAGFTAQAAVSAEPGMALPEPPPLELPAPRPPDLGVFPALVPAPSIPGAIAPDLTAPQIELPVWDLAVDLVARLPASAIVIDLPDSYLDPREDEP